MPFSLGSCLPKSHKVCVCVCVICTFFSSDTSLRGSRFKTLRRQHSHEQTNKYLAEARSCQLSVLSGQLLNCLEGCSLSGLAALLLFLDCPWKAPDQGDDPESKSSLAPPMSIQTRPTSSFTNFLDRHPSIIYNPHIS